MFYCDFCSCLELFHRARALMFQISESSFFADDDYEVMVQAKRERDVNLIHG